MAIIKLLVIDFRPEGIKKWHYTSKLILEYIKNIRQLSDGRLRYRITGKYISKDFPLLKNSPLQYDAASYNNATNNDLASIRVDGQYPMMDYEWFLDEFEILKNIENGIYDEVWMFGGPRMGFYESRMVGKNAYWCNAPALVKDSKNFVIMGFNYERDVRQMLHSFCHRVENILGKRLCGIDFIRKIYGGRPVRTWLLREFPRWIVKNGTAHHAYIGAEHYTQDEYAWLRALKLRWWDILNGI